MERVVLRSVPRDGAQPAVRYAVTTLIVLVAFLLRLGLSGYMASSPLLLFAPAAFLSALLFGKGAGIYATLLGATLAAVFFMPSVPFNPEQIPALLLFLVIGFSITAVVEALRQSIARLRVAERQKSLLLEEVAHRTKNDLTLIASLLTMQARSQADEAARTALEAAVGRIHTLAKAQDRLQLSDHGEAIDLGRYLEDICAALGELLRGVRPIAIRVRSDRVEIAPSQATSIGLIVNELVTNALKYAYPQDQGGTIEVTLDRADDGLLLGVRDDGVGCPQDAPEGIGSRVIRLLAAQLNGEVSRRPAPRGCAVSLRIPLGRRAPA
jgi:two-component sensor histidine kinase